MPVNLILQVAVDAPNHSQAVECHKPLSNVEEVTILSTEEAPTEAIITLDEFMAPLVVATHAAKLENPQGEVQLGVIASNKNGTGRVTARFGIAFIQDLQAILKALPYEDSDEEP